MAEFLNRPSDYVETDGMAAFGKEVPMYRRDAAMQHCREMGCKDTDKMMFTIQRMSDAIQRDEPYKAMEAGMQLVDLTGTYRLLAVLCTAEKPVHKVKALSQKFPATAGDKAQQQEI